jgi:hypothetical protein
MGGVKGIIDFVNGLTDAQTIALVPASAGDLGSGAAASDDRDITSIPTYLPAAIVNLALAAMPW